MFLSARHDIAIQIELTIVTDKIEVKKMKSNRKENMKEIIPLKASLSSLRRFEHRVTGKQNQVLEIRLLNKETDLPMLNRWFNLDYSKKFWGMDGYTDEQLFFYYSQQIERSGAAFYVILIDGHLIAYFEIYYAASEEIGSNQRFGDKDIGLHFLLGPGKDIIRCLPNQILHLTRNLLILAIDYIFTYGNTDVIIVEPDIKNISANELAKRVGFTFCCEVKLSNKTANLYRFCGQDFKKLYRFTTLSNPNIFTS